MKKKIVLSSILLPLYLFSNNLVLDNFNNSLDLTVYKNGKGVVSLSKDISIDGDVDRIILKKIPKTINENNILISFDKNGINIKNQRYINYIDKLDILLEKFIGKKVTFNKDNIEYEGILKSVNPTIVESEDTRQVFFVNDNTKIVLKKMDDLMIENHLEWKVSSKPNKYNMNIKYGLSNIDWEASYIINLKKDNLMDFQAWINITNNSGVDFENARVFVASGDLLKTDNKKERKPYTLYDLKEKANIVSGVNNQINYLSSNNVKYKKYAFTSFKQGKGNHGEVHFAFKGIISFDNIKEKGLGKLLPEGKINIFKDDMNGKSHLIGVDYISDTSKFKSVNIESGKVKNVLGKVIMKKYSMSKNHEKGIQEFIFNNKGDEEQEVKFRFITQKYGNISAKDTCAGDCSFTNISKNIKEYTIHLRGNGQYILRRTFEIYY